MARGEFENLPGTGDPLPDAGVPYDPAWWAKKWIARIKEEEQLAESQADDERTDQG